MFGPWGKAESLEFPRYRNGAARQYELSSLLNLIGWMSPFRSILVESAGFLIWVDALGAGADGGSDRQGCLHCRCSFDCCRLMSRAGKPLAPIVVPFAEECVLSSLDGLKGNPSTGHICMFSKAP